jgi:hypothetical protein
MAYVILHTKSAERWAGKHAEFSLVLKTHARGRLPGFAIPEWIVVVKELPVRPVQSYLSALDHPTRKRQLGKL